MIELKKYRRTNLGAALIGSIVGLGIGLAALENKANAQREAQGYMLAATEGEQLIRNGGSIFIKVAPSKGSDNLALGTQQVPVRAGIPVHQHAEMDEVFYVLERDASALGSGAARPGRLFSRSGEPAGCSTQVADS